MDDDELAAEGLRQRVASEDALGQLARELLENPLVTRALTHAFEACEKAVRAREVALTALNIPSATDIERLTRRVRSASQRLEASRTSSTASTGASPRSTPTPTPASRAG